MLNPGNMTFLFFKIVINVQLQDNLTEYYG